MKCPNCGGQLGLEDAVCPYCNTPNAMAVQHQSDMARYQREYQRTQSDVLEKTSLMQRHGSWLVIMVVLLVALIGGMFLLALSWDIGYSIRERNAEQNLAENAQVLDEYLQNGEYGQFLGYYDANDISLSYDNPYQAVRRAAGAYVDLVQYVSTLGKRTGYTSSLEYRSGMCGFIAEDLIKIYTVEQQFTYDADRYFSPEKRAYIEDMRERAGALAQTYFGLTEEEVREIPNMSASRLTKIIEEALLS